MPVLCLKVDSDASKVGKTIQYEIVPQPLRLTMIAYHFYNPADNTPLYDPYIKSLKVRLPFLNSHSFVTNSLGLEDGIDIPICIENNKPCNIITGLDLTFEPTRPISVNMVQGEVYHRVSPTKLETYTGFYTDPADPATKTNVNVTVSLYFEYDILQFDN